MNILLPDKYKSFQRFVDEPRLHVSETNGKIFPSILISPIISNLDVGFIVPIPIFPSLSIVNTSVLLFDALNIL